MTTPKEKNLESSEELSPYTEKNLASEEHTLGTEDYKSPYVTEEPEPDKSSIVAESPYTESDDQKAKKGPEEDLSPYTKEDAPGSTS